MSFNGEKFHWPWQWKQMAIELAAENAELKAKLSVPRKRKLPDERRSRNISANIGDRSVTLIIGEYDDGTPGEVFVEFGKPTEDESIYAWLTLAISIGLHWGAPVDTFIEKFEHQKNGATVIQTTDPLFREVKSIVDWIAKRLKHHYQKQENG
jgi:ribonucleoside-diphosphate reductase alpha chain